MSKNNSSWIHESHVKTTINVILDKISPVKFHVERLILDINLWSNELYPMS